MFTGRYFSAETQCYLFLLFRYKNVFDAIARVAKEEGISKLYSGLAPNILRGMSINVGMLACYDQAKEMIAVHLMNESPTGPYSKQTQMGASIIAGFTAAGFSLPFDMLKSRLQDGAGKSITGVFTKILRIEGVLAFWTGFGAYYMRTAPHAMLVLMLTEPYTGIYNNLFMK